VQCSVPLVRHRLIARPFLIAPVMPTMECRLHAQHIQTNGVANSIRMPLDRTAAFGIKREQVERRQWARSGSSN
jgi:hypothetical protein